MRATAGGTYFLYDGDDPIIEVGSNGFAQAVNIFGPDGWRGRYGGDMGNGQYYTFDPQGNVVQPLRGGSNGTVPIVAATQAFDGFGEYLGGHDYEDNPFVNGPVGFGGQWGYYTDLSTGYVFMTHRYYDPSTGRWINRDPIGTAGGINLYGFVGNNPITGADPDGTSETGDFLLGAGDAVNPVNWFKGSWAMGCAIGNVIDGKLSAKKLGSGMVQGLEFWNQSTARDAGRSFTTDIMLLEGARAGYGAVRGFLRRGAVVGAATTTEGVADALGEVENSASKFTVGPRGLTNGKYIVNAADMAIHDPSSTETMAAAMRANKSVFFYGLNADEIVLRAAQYADENGLWIGNKAKVPCSGLVGVLGDGTVTNWVNVYRTNTGFIHGCPGTVP